MRADLGSNDDCHLSNIQVCVPSSRLMRDPPEDLPTHRSDPFPPDVLPLGPSLACSHLVRLCSCFLPARMLSLPSSFRTFPLSQSCPALYAHGGSGPGLLPGCPGALASLLRCCSCAMTQAGLSARRGTGCLSGHCPPASSTGNLSSTRRIRESCSRGSLARAGTKPAVTKYLTGAAALEIASLVPVKYWTSGILLPKADTLRNFHSAVQQNRSRVLNPCPLQLVGPGMA